MVSLNCVMTDFFQILCTMAHNKFDLSISKKFISCEGPNITVAEMRFMCFSFDLCQASASGAITSPVEIVPSQIVKQRWLYGPATDLASRRVSTLAHASSVRFHALA